MSTIVSNPSDGIRFFDSRTDDFIETEALAPVAPVDPAGVNHLLRDLKLANPEAIVRVGPVPHDPQSPNHMVRLTGTGLDLMLLLALGKYNLTVDFFRATRSGADAVVTIFCRPLGPELRTL